MGRSRQQKTKSKTNVFKVSGNRSLKAKKQGKFNDNLKLVSKIVGWFPYCFNFECLENNFEN